MVRDDGDLDADEVLRELMESKLNVNPNWSEILLEQGAEVDYEDGDAYIDFEGDTYTHARDAFADKIVSQMEAMT